MSRTRVAAERWRRIFRKQRVCGDGVAAFCRRAGVAQSSFYAWQRRLRSATSFVEVKLPAKTVAETSEIELRLPCGRCVVIRPGFDRATLRELLMTLESYPSSGNGPETSHADRERLISADVNAPRRLVRREARR